MKTAYELLGVPRGATQSEIEQRYRLSLNTEIVRSEGRRLSRRERARMDMLRQAYLVLASPVRRSAYDRALLAREQWRQRLALGGGLTLAVLSLLAGVALLGRSWIAARHDTAALRPRPVAEQPATRLQAEAQVRPAHSM